MYNFIYLAIIQTMVAFLHRLFYNKTVKLTVDVTYTNNDEEDSKFMFTVTDNDGRKVSQYLSTWDLTINEGVDISNRKVFTVSKNGTVFLDVVVGSPNELSLYEDAGANGDIIPSDYFINENKNITIYGVYDNEYWGIEFKDEE